MNKENTLKLLNTFPRLYSNFHANYPAERKIPFEFQCRDGWFDLIWDLSQELEIEIIITKRKENLIINAVQVKEKDGTLRFYMSQGQTDFMSKVIGKAIDLSAITCEVCGAPGELRGGRWKFTLCKEHEEELILKGFGF